VKSRAQAEFGDFQTPPGLAERVARVVAASGFAPRTLVEPSCGVGNLLVAGLETFAASVTDVLGVDIAAEHLDRCRDQLAGSAATVSLREDSFFSFDWKGTLAAMPEPLLVIGNPPWVTSAALGALASANLPVKHNRRALAGIDAITGKSNFDISEWLIDRVLGEVCGRDAALAMLCKTSVARKVLAQAWRDGHAPSGADIYPIDAAREFAASVDACLLLLRFAGTEARQCQVHSHLAADAPVAVDIGWRDGRLVADLERYRRWRHLAGSGPRWRSGVKHDCARIMELTQVEGGYENGLGQVVDLEPDYLYPLLKSSDLARGGQPRRWVLVPQRAVGEATAPIARSAPRTWAYLCEHGDALDRRASSVYRKRPRFSVFGIGDYSFSSWKVAIAGLYKKLRFNVVGPHLGRPTLVDDTAYFLPCASADEARQLVANLSSPAAREFFAAVTFWDGKRPITAALLRGLDLAALAHHLGAG
jgi:hypothetical protein